MLQRDPGQGSVQWLQSQPVSWGPPTERADAARNRRLLLATARATLAEQGPDRLTMDGLAEQAGVGKGTVFRRFGTRAGIFQALLDDDEREFQQVLAGPPRSARAPRLLHASLPTGGPEPSSWSGTARSPERRWMGGERARRMADAHVPGTHPACCGGRLTRGPLT